MSPTTLPNNKPIASLSLDMDNKWTYQRTHGDTGWKTYPSYLPILVPRVLDLVQARNLTITFFVVGKDATFSYNQEPLQQLARSGHEIGNHSFMHEQWLHLYSRQQIDDDLARAEEEIERATGQRPRGFRGPGFSLSAATLDVLSSRGYLYDASTFPTFLGPLARAYYFMTAKLTPEEKEQRKKLFGTLQDGLRPNKAYRWQVEHNPLIEIPVTTMPVAKIPVHVSYILYLSRYSTVLALTYFKMALAMCKLTGTELSLLLHPLDFLGGDDETDLSFFPAMNLPGEQKLRVVSEVLRLLTDRFTVVPMREHAQIIAGRKSAALIRPQFGADQI